jgi:hypothetical protein
VLEQRDIEIDEKAEMKARKPEIREHLCSMNGLKPLDGLEFQQNRILDNEVSAKTDLDDVPVVFEGYRALPIKRERSSSELMREATFVCTFQKAGSKFTVDFHGGANYLSAQGVDVHGRFTAKVAESAGSTRLI